jgi:NAD(P)-dependent dehydrogenase (short-subunit alcohol dehydrogenase family)
MAQRGARVMAVARTEGELKSLAGETPVEYLAESVASEEGCRRIVEETERRLGPVEILINNAGIGSAHERPIWEQTPEIWRESLAVNLDAPFHLTRLVAPGMIKRGWGRVVIVSSTSGEVAGGSESAYVAGKHGVLGLMRAAAYDLAAHGITCNAVLPGWVRTAMADRSADTEARKRDISIDEVWEQRAKEYPAGRVVRAEEVAAAIAFLASEEASGVNGVALRVALGGVW